jgi:ABC-2 type transport system ATP-binding protein
VLLTTHDLDDVERLCKRILIIDQGKVLFDGATRELRRRYAPYRLLEITVDGNGREALAEIARDTPAGTTVRAHTDLTATFEVDPEVTPVAAVIAEISARVPVVDLGVREPEMDGIIREIYEAREVTR